MKNLKKIILAVMVLNTHPLITISINADQELSQAAVKNDLAGAKNAILHGANVNATDSNGWNILVYPVQNGNLKMTRILIEAGGNVSLQTNSESGSQTLLTVAAQETNDHAIKIMQVLLNAPDGTQTLNLKDKNGFTPLMYAVMNKNKEMIKTIIKAQAATTPQSNQKSHERTALMLAVWVNASSEIIQELLKATDIQESINLQDSDGFTALMLAVTNNNSEAVSILIQAGAKTTLQSDKDTGLETALIKAIWNEHPSLTIVKELLKALDIKDSINRADATGRTALMRALQNQDTAIVMVLIPAGATTTITPGSPEDVKPPLLAALVTEHPSITLIQALLSAHDIKDSINVPDKDGFPPLMYAIQTGNLAIVALFINAGAKIGLKSSDFTGEQTPLMGAVRILNASPVIVKELLKASDAQEALNIASKDGYTALMYATQQGDESLVSILLKAGATNAPVKANEDSLTALLVAFMQEKISLPIIKELMKASDIRTTVSYHHYGVTALMLAVETEDVSLVRLLLTAGATTTYQMPKSHNGLTALMLTFFTKHLVIPVIKELLNAQDIQDSINLQATNGATALITAVRAKSLEAVTLLLAKDAKTTPQADDIDNFMTALMFAVAMNIEESIALIKELLTAHDIQQSINLQDKQGATALILAVKINDSGMVQVLTQAKDSDLDIKDNDGNSALIYAVNDNNIPLVNILIGAGANPNIQDATGATPLILAAQKSYSELIEVLLKVKTIDLNQQDNKGMSALMYLAKNNALSILELPVETLGIQINLQNKLDGNKTALDYATEENCIQFLKDKGALSGTKL